MLNKAFIFFLKISGLLFAGVNIFMRQVEDMLALKGIRKNKVVFD